MTRPRCGRAHERWCSRAHADLVDDYRAARAAWEAGAEQYDRETGQRLELEDYAAQHPPPTFRAWLQGTRP